jgi:hypothetical protein
MRRSALGHRGEVDGFERYGIGGILVVGDGDVCGE